MFSGACVRCRCRVQSMGWLCCVLWCFPLFFTIITPIFSGNYEVLPESLESISIQNPGSFYIVVLITWRRDINFGSVSFSFEWNIYSFVINFKCSTNNWQLIGSPRIACSKVKFGIFSHSHNLNHRFFDFGQYQKRCSRVSFSKLQRVQHLELINFILCS